MNLPVVVLDGTSLTCAQVAAVTRGEMRVDPGEQGRQRARAAAEVAAIVAARQEVYGRTTGVGANRGLKVLSQDAVRHGLRLDR
jgi:histidine ammonia-lyase